MADNTTGTELGIIQISSDNLTNINDFLKNDKNITLVECPFPYVTSAASAFQYCSNLKSFKGDLEKLNDGNHMFDGCGKLETFTGKLPKLRIGNSMFYYTNLSEFTEDLPSLENGTEMFRECESLKKFYSDLALLQNGIEMFQDCENLKIFDSNLQSLTTYLYMFRNTKLNTFKAVEINVTDTGENFMKNSYLSTSKDTLTSFNCNLTNMTNTDNMFKNYTALQYVTSYMPKVTSSRYMFAYCYAYDAATATATGLQNFECNLIGSNDCFAMFRGCGNLSYVNAKTNNLQQGQHMFRDCSKLNENNFHLDTDSSYSTHFYGTLVNAIAMFQGTSFTKIPNSWKFKSLEISKQMFSHTQIGANGETVFIDMPNQFPKVKVYKEGDTYKYGDPGKTPVSRMFENCPIKSINFDVSSLDNGISMFCNCTQLTQCTGAEFQEGGSYQSMFTESKFDQGSAQLIFNYAKLANVASLHIGIGFQLTEEHDFVKENSLIKYSQDNSGKQWCEGYAYCHCHNVDEAAAREYFQQHGVAKHCHNDNAVTYYFENPSIMFVCNPN